MVMARRRRLGCIYLGVCDGLVLGTRRDETRSEHGPGRLVSSRQNVCLARHLGPGRVSGTSWLCGHRMAAKQPYAIRRNKKKGCSQIRFAQFTVAFFVFFFNRFERHYGSIIYYGCDGLSTEGTNCTDAAFVESTSLFYA
jgi:hypothetical protein